MIDSFDGTALRIGPKMPCMQGKHTSTELQLQPKVKVFKLTGYDVLVELLKFTNTPDNGITKL